MAKLNLNELRPKPDPNWRQKALIFLKLKPITKLDLMHNTGCVQHLTADEFWNKKPDNPYKFSFGKYKDRLFSEIKEEDNGYWCWCLENVSGFRNKIPKDLL